MFAQFGKLCIELQNFLQKYSFSKIVQISADYARHQETLNALEYVIPFSEKIISDKLKNLNEFKFVEQKPGQLLYQYNDGLKIKL